MGRFKEDPFDRGYCEGSTFDCLFNPRHDYQPDERAEYLRGFNAGRAAVIASKRRR